MKYYIDEQNKVTAQLGVGPVGGPVENWLFTHDQDNFGCEGCTVAEWPPNESPSRMWMSKFQPD